MATQDSVRILQPSLPLSLIPIREEEGSTSQQAHSGLVRYTRIALISCTLYAISVCVCSSYALMCIPDGRPALGQ